MVGKFRAKDRANYNLCAVNQNLSSGGESNITSDTMVQNLRGILPHFPWRAHEDKTIKREGSGQKNDRLKVAFLSAIISHQMRLSDPKSKKLFGNPPAQCRPYAPAKEVGGQV